MPRELSDVLHYFLPVSEPAQQSPPPSVGGEPAQQSPPPSVAAEPARRPATGPALPIVAVPVAPEDAVRAALLWSLSIEIARRGGRSLLLRPATPDGDPSAWPRPGRQPLGAELVEVSARSLGDLYRASVDAALLRSAEGEPGLVLVQVPPAWLAAPGDGAALLEWTLLLTRGDASDLRATWRLAKALVEARPEGRLGITIHGATSRQEAERGFATLARAARERLGREVASYGLLADDLHVYRAVTDRRPIGVSQPQSLAARALHDVAGTLLEDASDLRP